MPSAWEEPGLTHNLDVLATLATKPVGTKLKFNADSGEFDIDERYLISRMISPDSVTSKTHFATPMEGLLRTAQGQIGRGRVTQETFDAALAGLVRLRRTYEGTPDKAQALDKVLKSVDGAVSLAREGGSKGAIVVSLRRKYERHLIYAVRQRNYLDVNQDDVCHAFVIDWGRRILAGKASYAVRGNHTTFAGARSLSRAEHVRMQKMVNRVAVLQGEERARLSRGERLRTSFPDDPKFGSVMITGERLMEVGTFERTARGRTIFRAIVDAGRAFREVSGARVFLVRLDGAPKAGSHMLGLHIYGDRLEDLHVFDPNVGEFRFMRGAETPFSEFCDDLVTDLYSNKGVLLFDSWVISRLYTNPWRAAAR
jgi:hypothetical protein